MVKCLPEFEVFFAVVLKKRSINIIKIRKPNVTNYAALKDTYILAHTIYISYKMRWKACVGNVIFRNEFC